MFSERDSKKKERKKERTQNQLTDIAWLGAVLETGVWALEPQTVVMVDFLVNFGLTNQKEEVTTPNAQIDNRSIFFVVEAKQVKTDEKKQI